MIKIDWTLLFKDRKWFGYKHEVMIRFLDQVDHVFWIKRGVPLDAIRVKFKVIKKRVGVLK